MQLTSIDWAVVAVYGVVTLVLGFWFTRRAGQSVEEYFVAGRSLPWWLAGTSIAATWFVTDAPLATAALVRTRDRCSRCPNWRPPLLRPQISIHRLLVEAFEHGSRDALLQALLLDPTTVSYRAAVDLIDLMCEKQAEVLPRLEWQRKPAARG